MCVLGGGVHGKTSSGVQCGLRVGPGQKADMLQATEAQLRRVMKKLAKSWKLGGATTLTEDIAFGDQKKEWGRVI